MRTPIFQVDAFTTQRFAGNPAAVLPLDEFPSDAIMQLIAAENNLAETAFLVRDKNDYRLRWFTPTVKVPLCGHATLASAAVVMERLEPGRSTVMFLTASGPLFVKRTDARYVMDFPVRATKPIPAPQDLAKILGADFETISWDGLNYLALLSSAKAVRELRPDMAALEKLECAGVIVTALGDAGYDFVSRYFAPANGIPEDPVTGGAHCALAYFWSERLGRNEFRAFQASQRGGEVVCRLAGNRVELEGAVVFYMEGTVEF